MVKCLIAVIVILSFIEVYSLAIMVLAKKAGINNYRMAFIPFYSFLLVGKIIGVFSIMTIPVKKYHSYMLTIFIIFMLALIYANWGTINLPEVSSDALIQIMSILYVLCALLTWISLIITSKKIFRKYRITKEKTFTLLTVFVITIPFLYLYASKNSPRTLKEMY